MFMGLAGFGTILVGLFPENSISNLHITGATLPFVFGNLGVLIVGICSDRFPHWLRNLSIFFGVTGLIGLVLYLLNISLGIGHGGMERVTAYPQTIWMIITGVFLLVLQNRKDVA